MYIFMGFSFFYVGVIEEVDLKKFMVSLLLVLFVKIMTLNDLKFIMVTHHIKNI